MPCLAAWSWISRWLICSLQRLVSAVLLPTTHQVIASECTCDTLRRWSPKSSFSAVQPDICLQADELMSLLPDSALPLHTTPGRVSGVPANCLAPGPARPVDCIVVKCSRLPDLGLRLVDLHCQMPSLAARYCMAPSVQLQPVICTTGATSQGTLAGLNIKHPSPGVGTLTAMDGTSMLTLARPNGSLHTRVAPALGQVLQPDRFQTSS